MRDCPFVMECCLGGALQLSVREMVPVASSGTISTCSACDEISLEPSAVLFVSAGRRPLVWVCSTLPFVPTCKELWAL